MVKPGKKKKFIDKNKSVTFHLVHRSQKDPLAADEDAPRFVLEQVGGHGDPKAKTIKKELPAVVFASEVEEDVGLLNKAAPLRGPQLDWDPDIVATFDETFDVENAENQLEDDFISKANAEGEGTSDTESENSNFSDERYDDFFDDLCFGKDETKSQFTEYSVSSSVITRSDGLKLLDDRFEQHYKQYEDIEIGALDQDEIAGRLTVESDIFKQLVEEDEKRREKSRETHFENDLTKEWLDREIGDSEEVEKLEIEEPNEKWDCESILSTYSNLYNHPRLIELQRSSKVITIAGKTGIPKNTLNAKLTISQMKTFDKSNKNPPLQTGIDNKLLIRPKEETKEEKAARKKAVKEHKKIRRVEKKANTNAFKEEKKRQEKVMTNLQQNLTGIKLM